MNIRSSNHIFISLRYVRSHRLSVLGKSVRVCADFNNSNLFGMSGRRSAWKCHQMYQAPTVSLQPSSWSVMGRIGGRKHPDELLNWHASRLCAKQKLGHVLWGSDHKFADCDIWSYSGAKFVHAYQLLFLDIRLELISAQQGSRSVFFSSLFLELRIKVRLYVIVFNLVCY